MSATPVASEDKVAPAALTQTATWPPLPTPPAPSSERTKATWPPLPSAPPSVECQTPTWPPLPPLGLAGDWQPPLPVGPPPNARGGSQSGQAHFEQQSGFQKDGSVARPREHNPLQRFFDFPSWADA